jgi:RNA polymerase sigma factor (TIGR02999 family)
MVNDDMPQDRAGDAPDNRAPDRATGDVTMILSRIEQGEPQAAEQLLPLVYEELRKLAAAKMAQEKPGQTLQATALVHEAYIRLVDVEKAQHWDSRGHFFAAAAEAIRRILVDNARQKGRLKRGAELVRHDVHEIEIIAPGKPVDILAIDEALRKLEASNDTAARLVKLRYFSGLTVKQAAAALGMSSRKADQIWAYARVWLLAEMGEGDRGETRSVPQ